MLPALDPRRQSPICCGLIDLASCRQYAFLPASF
jgi:hypothetical protein